MINIRELRRLASQGIPDGGGIRSTVWKLLLGYLPADRGLWFTELAKKRCQYKNFKDELLMNPVSFVFPLSEIDVNPLCFLCLEMFRVLNLFMPSQSEITRRLEKSAVTDQDDPNSEGSGLLSRSEIPEGEHPLSLGQSSIWNKFFQVSC